MSKRRRSRSERNAAERKWQLAQVLKDADPSTGATGVSVPSELPQASGKSEPLQSETAFKPEILAQSPANGHGVAGLGEPGGNTSNGWLLSFYTVDKRKRSLWLGSISKRQAFNVKRHVEELIRASKAKGRPEGETEAWAAELDGKLRSGFERAGLVAAIPQRSNSDTARLLGPCYVQHCATDSSKRIRFMD